MKNVIIISGEKASGKTYEMVSYAVRSASHNNNVFIITEDAYSLKYFECIISEAYPLLRFERKKDGFMFVDSLHNWFIYCVPFSNIHKYYYELSLADEIMIDEYTTLTRLIKQENFVECTKKTTSVIVNISDYYFYTGRFGVYDVIKKLGANVIFKRVQKWLKKNSIH